MNEFPYKRENEEKKNAAAIDKIAASMDVPKEEVRQLYERVLAEMQQRATVRTFLAIFAARRVEEFLRRRNSRYPESL